MDAICADNGGHLALGRVRTTISCANSQLNFHFLLTLRSLLVANLQLFFFSLSLFLPFQLTWADIYFAGILDYLNYMVKADLLEKHPNLNRCVKGVMELEQIKAWLEKRPQTDV